jgi:hypothetical protein
MAGRNHTPRRDLTRLLGTQIRDLRSALNAELRVLKTDDNSRHGVLAWKLGEIGSAHGTQEEMARQLAALADLSVKVTLAFENQA